MRFNFFQGGEKLILETGGGGVIGHHEYSGDPTSPLSLIQQN
jgi:hypothetical protein